MTLDPFNGTGPRSSSTLLLLAATIAIALSARSKPAAASAPAPGQGVGQGGPDQVIAWNDLGMHCGDPDYSVFSILPPFNTINAQIVRNGQFVGGGGGLSFTYEAVVDTTGSINSTSIGKSNFWQHVFGMFGVALPLDVGLAGNAMPGVANTPQPMHLDPTWSWFQGEGIPILPIDDAFQKNPYPMMRVTARSSSGQVIASTVTTVPNSQELNCSLCHSTGTSPFARPSGGWVYDADPLVDDRLNILRLHDEKEAQHPLFVESLAVFGYDPAGLEATARSGRAILCATCHSSNALPGTGYDGVSALTSAIHLRHAEVVDESLTALDDNPDRSSCYQCHPGFDTQCLRGAMGTSIGADGDFSMSCQSCHGDNATVGDPSRVGWLEEPTCQQCHTGSATQNSGEIRYTSVFDGNGSPHVAASNLFATNDDVPADGFSLYRFSSSHGGLQCSACHGSPHAIYPTREPNDNLQNTLLQGHAGTLMECSSCHSQLEDDELIGPHGMHPTSQGWATDKHADHANHNLASCASCHGADFRGSVLSRAKADRSYATEFGQKSFWSGFQVSCFACHDGPNDDDANSNQAPSVSDLVLATPSDVPLAMALTGSDANGDALTFRIVSQPQLGSVALNGSVATYLPVAPGSASFTYAAWDGETNSNLGSVTVNVGAPTCPGETRLYGFGCPADGAFVPTLAVNGCPEPGGTLSFTLDDTDGSAIAFLIVGTGRAERELGPGCVLRIARISSLKTLFTTPGGPGDGHATIAFTLPATASGKLNFQGFIRRPNPPFIGTFTNAIEITLP